MSKASTSESPDPASKPGRFSGLAAIVTATALFALAQALFIFLRQQSFDLTAAIGLSKVGVIAAVPTVLGLALLAWLLRRWHPAAARGDRPRAFRALLFGFVAALTVWMIVDSWVTSPLVAAAVGPWIALAAALVAGFAVGRRPPSARFCRRAWPLAIVAFAVVVAPMTDPRVVAEPPAEVTFPGTPGFDLASAPDVVLISVDTFRADRLAAYGSTLALTPEIDRFAEEGFVFERALAASPWTVPSMASALTGLSTLRHGAGLHLGSGQTFLRSPMKGDAVTVAQRFSAAGYRTHAVVANGFLSPPMGMARGFDEFDTPFTRATGSLFVRDIPLARLVLALYPVERWGDYRAQALTDKALALLAREAEKPLFLWLHYIDPHTPFQADPSRLDLAAWDAEIHQTQPKADAEGAVVGEVFAGTSNVRGGMLWLDAADRGRIEEYYNRAVAYVDGELGRLFAALRDPGRERPLAAALVADHGEEFWDHGHFEHGHDFYREVTRIPMIFWAPGSVPAGRAEREPVGLVDVAPTLLGLAGLTAPEARSADEGSSLVASWAAASEATPGDEAAAGEGRIRYSEGNLYGMPSVLLEEGDWRFILRSHGAAELYHAFDDPLELTNRVAERPELVARYRALLEPRLALLLAGGGGEAPELDAETLRSLQSLGYVQ